jgi:hypothetical protein
MPKEYWRPFQKPLLSSEYTLGNAQIEVETCWAHFPACLQPIGSEDTPSAYWPTCLNMYQTYWADFYEAWRFNYTELKIRDIIEKFNNYQRFFSYFSLSNHTTFAQTQTGATVLLKTE